MKQPPSRQVSQYFSGPEKTASGLGLAARYLDIVQNIVAQIFGNTACIVYLFGSRARGTHTTTSDIDLAVASSENLGNKLSLLREALESSTIPLFVDVVDLSQAGTTFLEQVQNEGVIIWKNQP